MSQAEGLACVRVRSRGEHIRQTRKLKGVMWLGSSMGNVAGERAEGQTAQALVSPWAPQAGGGWEERAPQVRRERAGAQCVYLGFLAPPAIKISTGETGDIITCSEKN